MKKVCLFLLLCYKRFLSPLIGNGCRYIPTCSMYTYDAVERYGALIGSVKGFFRVLRCNPFSKGGFEPVTENYRGNVKWLI